MLLGFFGAVTLTPLGEIMVITQEGGGTVILESTGYVRFRVKDGRVPVQVGRALFVPSQRGMTAFRLP